MKKLPEHFMRQDLPHPSFHSFIVALVRSVNLSVTEISILYKNSIYQAGINLPKK